LVARSTPLLLTNAVLIRFDTSAATRDPGDVLVQPDADELGADRVDKAIECRRPG
jgi:hypothetical protein